MTNYTVDSKELLKGYDVTKEKGLSSEQVTLHRTKYGENKLLEKGRKSIHEESARTIMFAISQVNDERICFVGYSLQNKEDIKLLADEVERICLELNNEVGKSEKIKFWTSLL